jgi:hypothetical protein
MPPCFSNFWTIERNEKSFDFHWCRTRFNGPINGASSKMRRATNFASNSNCVDFRRNGATFGHDNFSTLVKIMKTLAIIAVMVISQLSFAQDVNLEIEKRGLQASEQYRANKKNELNHRMVERLAMKKSARLTGDLTTDDHFAMSGKNNEHREFVTSNKKTLQEAIDRNKDQIEKLRADIDSSPEWRTPEIDVFDVRIPCFGNIDNSIEVNQITGKSRFIGRIGKATFIFDGFDTSKFSDGQLVSLQQVVKIVETETYATVIGATKTVYKIVPLNDQEQASINEASTKKRDPFKGDNFRTWTDSSKKFSVKAWFVEREKANVVLKKENGETLKIPLAKLCFEDKNWIRDWEL